MAYTMIALAAALALGPAGPAGADPGPHVRVHAHILLLDRTEATRVGLGWVQVGGGLVAVQGLRGGGHGAGLPVSAFIDLARDRNVLRSETRTQVLALSGAEAAVSSGSMTVGRRGATRVQGPELVVIPTLLEDGRVALEVRARLRDEATTSWGYRMDGSPVDVATTVIVWPGEDATVGSARVETRRSDAGLLRWESGSGTVDVLVVLRAEIL